MSGEDINLENMTKEEMAVLTERVILALCGVQESIVRMFHETDAILKQDGPIDVGAMQRAIVGHVQTCGAYFQQLEHQRQLLLARPSGSAN